MEKFLLQLNMPKQSSRRKNPSLDKVCQRDLSPEDFEHQYPTHRHGGTAFLGYRMQDLPEMLVETIAGGPRSFEEGQHLSM